jgi:hypothetical protein
VVEEGDQRAAEASNDPEAFSRSVTELYGKPRDVKAVEHHWAAWFALGAGAAFWIGVAIVIMVLFYGHHPRP